MSTYYIATTGNDTTGNGSLANPWLTYSKFYTSSVNGDTCQCAAGTYTYAAMTLNQRHLVGAPLVNGFPTTIFDGAGATFAATGLQGTNSMTRIWFRNFTGPTGTNTGCFKYGTPGITTESTITNCVFSDITYPTNQNGNGLFNSPYDATATTAVFDRCLVFDILGTGTVNDAMVFRLSAQTNAGTFTLRNCTVRIAKSASNQVYLFGAQDIKSQWTLQNNIFVDYGVDNPTTNLATNRTSSACTNNLFYGFTSIPTMTGTITSDPQFVDPANDNFNLKATSPAVFTGALI